VDNAPTFARLSRREPPPMQVLGCDPAHGGRPEGLPPRPRSLLPDPGSLHLTLELERKRGDGRCGVVWATSNMSLFDPAGDAISSLPKLVVKVAVGRNCQGLMHEASVYEDLESIQGIAVPRCYGYFETSLSDDSVLRLRTEFDHDADPSDGEDGTQSPVASDIEPNIVGVLLVEYIPRHLPLPSRKNRFRTPKIDE
jgi:hypothetical protein